MTGSTVDEVRTVLVVDDEPTQVEMLELWLDPAYEVVTAMGGNEAMERVERGVDAIVVDRRMPDLSGDELAARLHDAGDDVPTVIVSAVVPTLDVVDVPFDAYLEKPFTKDDLHDAIEQSAALATRPEAERVAHRNAVKRRLLERNVPLHELNRSDAYADLVAEVEATDLDVRRLEGTTSSTRDQFA